MCGEKAMFMLKMSRARLRRHRTVIGFILLLGLFVWIYERIVMNPSCEGTSCTKSKTGNLEFDVAGEQLPTRFDNLLLIPNPIRNLQQIANASICTLPNLDPFEESVQHLIEDVGTDPGCIGPKPHFHVDDKGLFVPVSKTVAGAVRLTSVKFEPILRPDGDDFDFELGDEVFPYRKGSMDSSKQIKTDFIKISYKVKSESNEEDSDRRVFFSSKVAPKEDLVKKLQKINKESPPGIPLNVLILGFDSTSHATCRRKLPRTVNYLERELNAYILRGFSIVGDGTTPFTTALLCGKFVGELQSASKREKEGGTVDEWPFIFGNFKQHGYVTMHTEDDPKIATFNLRLNGFSNPPAHHYARPFWLAVENSGVRKAIRKHTTNARVCLGGETLHNFTMNYVLSMFKAYKNTPKFAFSFFSYISHGVPDKLSYVDEDLLTFLKIFHQKYRNNTMLVMISDHGARIGPLRNTMQGSLEERLPWASIVMPAWFEKQYPSLASNLRHNQDYVTSPFDLHATLQHLLSYPKLPQGVKTQSLFTEIGISRTCPQAGLFSNMSHGLFGAEIVEHTLKEPIFIFKKGIDIHWCPCLRWKPVSTSEKRVRQGAAALVDKINGLIQRYPFAKENCAKLELVRVVYAAMLDSVNTASEFLLSPVDGRMRRRRFPHGRRYQITIETTPGGGTFEGTTTIKKDGRVVVNPHVSRTSMYGDNPHCVTDRHPNLRRFCICNDRVKTVR